MESKYLEWKKTTESNQKPQPIFLMGLGSIEPADILNMVESFDRWQEAHPEVVLKK
jgi:hypothetical protein